jgi:NhaP-type Na+/H+ or K+/H+ antiporter
MHPELWFFSVGLLLIVMTISMASLKRLPLTAAILYLCVGFALGPSGLGLVQFDPMIHAGMFEHLSEVAVIISLFTAGLKLRLPLTAREWRVPFLLASLSMLVTILLVAAMGVFFLSLSLGAAVLLGAILAPTDPVLAASVQVLGPEDKDKLRFSLTGEAGLNDGTAFPFVMLGMGLLGLRELGGFGWRWFLLDAVWAVCGGWLVGTLLATFISRLIVYLRRKHEETQSLDDFLALGLICLTYGVALWMKACGFLAVFAAGLALRRGERKETQRRSDLVEDEDDPHPRRETPSANMARGVLNFNEQLERFGESVVVLSLGSMISRQDFSLWSLGLAVTLIFVIRPLSVLLFTRATEPSHRRLISWFGIRGIGSLYYLAFVIEQGLSRELATDIKKATFAVVTCSIMMHGVSSAPLMMRYAQRRNGC